MRYVLLAMIAALAPSCGSTKGKLRQADSEFGPRVGHDRREDIAALMGLPQQKDKIGDTEVWVYRSNEVGKARRVPFAGGNAYVTADELVLTFDREGVLKTYKANVNKVK